MNDQVRSLFHELADCSGPEREKIFAERHILREIRAEVESLLDFDSRESESFTVFVSRAADEVLISTEGRVLSYCGPYQLVELLGAGGMGAVYLGKRTDGEIQQNVAVKLLRVGADRPEWRERFLRERQLLADLNHPSIARLMDAGHTGDGLPYLVMEYVDGVSIDTYAADLHLNERLLLFLRVCEAVSYAHRHLIIHRDLKPSNIIVDRSGQPKLLDFGIAKLLNAAEPSQTVERLFTPHYASPEQISGGAQTTATDVYSLGAVLQKLLTGKSPHESKDQNAEAMMPRDIDCILQKALRTEVEERYGSVDALADDVRAFLESKPVRARAGNVWYRTRKFFRRYWLPAAAGAAAVTALAVGFAVANHERAIAQRRFDEVRQLSNKLFDIDARIRGLPGATDTRQFIVETSLEYLRRLAAEARNDPDLALDVGTAYMRVGRVQGVPITPNLGQSENAEQNLRIAEGLIKSVLEAQPANRTAFLRAAQIAHDRMVLAQARRPDTEAMPLAVQSQEWLEKYLNAGDVEEAEKVQVVIAGMNVANWYVRKARIDEGLRLLRRTIEIAKATNQPAQAGAAQIVTARALRSLGDLEGALVAIGEGVRLLKPPGGQFGLPGGSYGLSLATQGEILGEDNAVSLGRSQEAAESFEQAFNIYSHFVKLDSKDAVIRFAFANDGIKLANIIRHTDSRRAAAIYEEVLSRLTEITNNPRARRDEVRALAASSYVLRQVGNSGEARKRLDIAFSRLSELKLYPADQIEPDSEADKAVRALAAHESAGGNFSRALEIYEELHRKLIASQAKPESNLFHALSFSNLHDEISVLHRRNNEPEKAVEWDTRRLELWRQWERKLPGNSFVQRQLESLRQK
jgi:tetratricopeptide (TPR) repeat protein